MKIGLDSINTYTSSFLIISSVVCAMVSLSFSWFWPGQQNSPLKRQIANYSNVLVIYTGDTTETSGAGRIYRDRENI